MNYDKRVKWALNRDNFAVIDNEWAAYWLGFIAADGCLIGTRRVSIGLGAADGEHLKKYAQWMGNKPVRHITRFNKQLGRDNSTVKYVTDVREICQDIRAKGVGDKKTENGFSLRGVPNDFFGAFLRGFFDGDGNVLVQTRTYKRASDDQYLSFRFAAHPSVATWLIEELRQRSIKASAYVMKITKKIVEVHVTGFKNVTRLAELMYTDSSIHLTRKKDKYDTWRKFHAGRPRQLRRNLDDIITRERLELAVSECRTRTGILKHLGVHPTRNGYRTLDRRAKELNVDLTQFPVVSYGN